MVRSILWNGRKHYGTSTSRLRHDYALSQGRISFSSRTDRIDQAAAERINRRSDLRKGDVLFTSIEPVGITYLLWETPRNWNINESVFTFRAKTEFVSSEFLFMLLSSNVLKGFCKNSSTGSIHKGIRHEALKSYNFPRPHQNTMDVFTKLVSPMLQQQFLLEEQNRELANLSDWLLPMLMNGQVTLGD